MDTILASIRRILNEDELSPAESAPDRADPKPADPERIERDGRDAVFVLRDSMMVQPDKIEPVPSAPAPIPPVPESAITPPAAAAQNSFAIDAGLVAARTRAATEQSFDALHDALRREQPVPAEQPASTAPSLLRSGGPSLEDLVRDELRSLLSSWLDVHLPTLVETLVRSEIAKLTRRG